MPAPRSRQVSPAIVHVVQTVEQRCLLSGVDVTQYKNSLQGTGANTSETALSPANVHVGSFGKLFATALDGQVYTEPLLVNGVNITTGPHAGIRDVVFVATENDTLYAIDADDAGLAGTILWSRSFTDLSIAGNNTLGASSISTLTSGDVGSNDINPTIGITATPVIDKASNTLFVLTKTKEVISGVTHFVQRMHAINLSDGTDRNGPYLIGDTSNGNSNNTQIYVYGTGDGAVTDPYNGTGKGVVQFNALREHDRAALSLVNGQLYAAFASHGDNGPYHGWVVSWNVSQLATNGFQLSGVFCTSPNNGLGGIWMGGTALEFEADGSAFYFETGNGSGGAPTVDANGFPINGNYNESLVKLTRDNTTSATSQNLNGWGFKVADYFTPNNVVALDNADADFGSGGPVILPDSMGVAGHPHLLIASGKQGLLYVVDRDNMGKFHNNTDAVVSENGTIGGLLSSPSIYNGKIYAVSGYSNNERSYTVNADGTLTQTSQTPTATFGYLPGAPFVSANGNTGGIVWTTDRNANVLHAYDANSLATELWNSSQKIGGTDSLGAVVKFAPVTVANGQVYVGTSNSLVVYGLTPPANAVPLPPTLNATTLSGSSIQLSWTDSTTSPNQATTYLIEQSTDGTNFTQVTTVPGGLTGVSIGGLNLSTTYFFRVRGLNGLGNSQYSNIASATTTNQLATIDFSGGFAGSTSKLTYNGSANINGTRAQLTSSTGGFAAGSVFTTNPVDISRFKTTFQFQIGAGTDTADGFTFAIQGNGPTALGTAGGDLGYGGIGNSIAIKFDLYNNSGEGPDSTGLYENGVDPFNIGSSDLSGAGIDLHSGDILQADITYDGTNLVLTISDTQNHNQFTKTYAVNIPGDVGGSTGYVGFTGANGGLTATQEILNWILSPNAVQAPASPTALGATAASATSVALNWTNNATNQTGFKLDRATDINFTQNLITQTLPATPNTFLDTATGLAPAGTYYYRIRATNNSGDSGNSNVASVSIPVAPNKPDSAHVTSVTTTSVSLEWNDNAGRTADGYRILRADNHGSFNQIVILPALNATPPNPYDWTDNSVVAGTFYEYHIIAFNVSGYNDFSGTNATTLTPPPGNVKAVASGSGINLSWDAVTGAVSYNVYRGLTPGGEGSTPLATNVTATNFADTNLPGGIPYYYFVTAVNGNTAPVPAESAPSAEVSATPNNHVPTDIKLSNNKLADNAPLGTKVGTFTTTDIDVNNTFTYTLASTGDSTAFKVDAQGNLLTNAVFDATLKNAYSVQVTSADQGGLKVTKTFSISVSSALTATFTPLTTPVLGPVSRVLLSFNEGVTGVSLQSFSLTRNGTAISLRGAVLSQLSSKQYTLDLHAVTGNLGQYVLTLNPNAVPIKNRLGTPLSQGANLTWTNTAITSFTVQNGAVERSYIRYLDIAFAIPTASIDNLLAKKQIRFTKYDLNGQNPHEVSLGTVTRVNNTLHFDFGPNGLGGFSSSGDGYYQLRLDLDGTGAFATTLAFYRLLGDFDGNRQVDQTDVNKIQSLVGKPAQYSLNYDVLGLGVIDNRDVNYVIRAKGRRLNAGLPLDA